MNNPWNIKMEMVFDSYHANNIKKFYLENRKISKSKLKDKTEHIESLKYLKYQYDNGYGLKVLARAIGVTYSVIRTIFDKADIDIRRGYNISTDKTKEFRRVRIIGDKNPWYDWPGKGILKNSKGYQGYYKRKSGEYVWLRSSWEYIYAKWLDHNNINWKFENIQYKLDNGESYRPDFFIYDENWNLSYLVEIKGYLNKDRLYKVDLLKFKYPELKIIVLLDVGAYTNNYKEDLKIWKTTRLSKLELKK